MQVFRRIQKTTINCIKEKNYIKSKRAFGTEELLKTANDPGQTDLEAKCFTIAKQTSCITFQPAIR